MFNPSSFEINLVKGDPSVASSFSQLGTFMVKYKMPAVVTDPMFIDGVLFEKIKCGDRFKVICAVDFDGGKGYAGEKFRNLPRSAVSADGFDILISARKLESEMYNELNDICRFIRENLSQTKEIRWTLGLRARTYDAMKLAMPAIKKFPPQFVRTTHLNLPDVSLETHLKDVEFIRSYTGAAIKVGGGLTVSVVEALSNKVSRFDVTLAQAQKLIRQSEMPKPVEKVIADDLAKVKPYDLPSEEAEDADLVKEISDAELAADIPPPEAE